VNTKREARRRYYEGVREATLTHIRATEEGLRKLESEGVKPAKIEKLLQDLHKQHRKLLKRLDGHLKDLN
jgi:hypothetical protein